MVASGLAVTYATFYQVALHCYKIFLNQGSGENSYLI